jgi:hypothetical protein
MELVSYVFCINKQGCISNRCRAITANATPVLDFIPVTPEDGPNGTETCCLE